MDTKLKVNDWQCVGIATVGAAGGLGAELIMFQFRSKKADFLGEFLFIGGGIGAGGSLGGAVAPSPSDFANPGRVINVWSDLKGSQPFSADDLNNAYGKVTAAGVSAAYGYAVVFISAGFSTRLFDSQYVGGWGIGVGATATLMPGMWQRLSSQEYR